MIEVLALGEILWDLFPDGPRFGGAPANFACACAQMGGPQIRCRLGSAVGDDSLGLEALQRLAQRGVDASLVSRSDRPTGQVFVELDSAGCATYRFLDDTAWDHLTETESLHLAAQNAQVICFGTLGQRSLGSRQTIQSLLDQARPDCLRVLDLNLRPPHWSPEVVRASVARATVLKLNHEELPILATVLGLTGSEAEILQSLLSRGIRWIALTRGAEGSLIVGDGVYSELPGERVTVVDTVGAGDAFTAALVLGLVTEKPIEEIHLRASRLAAYVCTQSGGTPPLNPGAI